MSQESGATEPLPARTRQRAFRPLLWWFILSLALISWRAHERALLHTRLQFTPDIDGVAVLYEARLDSYPFESDRQIGLGWHRLVITARDTEPFITNLFIWYGGKDLGRLPLARSHGRMELSIQPVAQILELTGPYARYFFTNSSGLTSSVPVGQYQVEATHEHFRQSVWLNVGRNETTASQLHSNVANLYLESEPLDATYQLVSISSAIASKEGQLPASLSNLPTGRYRLRAQRGDYKQEISLELTNGAMLNQKLRFVYGGVSLNSQPWADVLHKGKILGQTPLPLTNLIPGQYVFRLERDGFESIEQSITILPDETASRDFKLVNLSYRKALKEAKDYAGRFRPDYERALAKLNDALVIESNDPTALQLQKEYQVKWHLQRAKDFGRKQDFVNAREDLIAALALDPNNPELLEHQASLQADQQTAARLQKERTIRDALAEIKRLFDRQDFAETLKALEQLHVLDPENNDAKAWQERVKVAQQQARLKHPEKLFQQEVVKHPDHQYFDQQFMQVKLPLATVRQQIIKSLDEAPKWKLVHDVQADIHTVILVAEKTSDPYNRNKCILVASQVTEAEVHLYYKVWDYAGGPSEKDFVPVHSARMDHPSVNTRRQEVVSNFERRLTRHLKSYGSY